jgi:MFS family permease
MSLKQTLAHRHVKRFYLARFISSFGNGMGPIALAFGILHLKNGSASELGLVLGSTTVALLCVLPFGGVLADKYGRVFMCGASDIIAGLCLLVQVYYFHTGSVPLAALLFSNISFGIMWGIFWPSIPECFQPSCQRKISSKEMQLINSYQTFQQSLELQ